MSKHRLYTGAEAREIASAATPGPWGVWSDEGPITLPNGKKAGGWSHSVCAFEGTVANAARRGARHVCIGYAFTKGDGMPAHDAELMAAAPDLAHSLGVVEGERDALRSAVRRYFAAAEEKSRAAKRWGEALLARDASPGDEALQRELDVAGLADDEAAHEFDCAGDDLSALVPSAGASVDGGPLR